MHVQPPGDTAWARRFRDLLAQIIDDVATGQPGGAAELSEGQRQLCRRCATIAIACEKLECVAATGADIDLEQYGMLTDRLGRTFHRLGLKRMARETGMTLGEILRQDLERQRQEAQR